MNTSELLLEECANRQNQRVHKRAPSVPVLSESVLFYEWNGQLVIQFTPADRTANARNLPD